MAIQGVSNQTNYFVDSYKVSVNALRKWPPNPLPGITFAAGIIATGRLAYLYFHAKKKVGYGDCAITLTCWVGHDAVKKKIVIQLLERERGEFEILLNRSQIQLENEKKLTQKQIERISQLEAEGEGLGNVVIDIDQIVQRSRENTDVEKELVGAQTENVEEMERQIARLKGLLMVSREEHEDLKKDIMRSEEHKRQLQAGIEEMLERTLVATRELSEKVEELEKVKVELISKA
ncbi:MAG: hypothetical protein KFB95_01425 [Simkaniaceae bacterium]|nr:MAG: hypothetical protein KFB95_01425 [Simkaniaceae bacterium]